MLAPPFAAACRPADASAGDGVAVLGQVVEAAGARAPGPALGQPVSVELTAGPEVSTVADDEVVVHLRADRHQPARVLRLAGLAADTELDLGRALGEEADGLRARTLPRPPGERLATVTTVNDLHFGETECGVLEEPIRTRGLRVAPGEAPYPETMNRAAAAEMAALVPDAVVAKGDLTDAGRSREMESFAACYRSVFGDRLHWLLGNHDVVGPEPLAAPATQEVVVPGLVLALLDTTVPGAPGGQLGLAGLGWLDELASRADRPVLVMGHHPLWDPSWPLGPGAGQAFGINRADSQALVELVARRPSIIGYAAGHTHRNQVRHLEATGTLPWVEVAAVKDYPGTWAEYRVFEGGVLQVHRRISAPAALDWSERCRAMVKGLYPAYALGSVADRCFPLWPRRAA